LTVPAAGAYRDRTRRVQPGVGTGVGMSAAVIGLALVARFVLAAVFLIAGTQKLRSPGRLAHTMRSLGLGNLQAATLAARGLGGCEVAVGVWLVAGVAPAAAGLAAAAFLGIFTIALIALALRTGHSSVACGCFGDTGEEQPVALGLARNVLLIAAAVVVAASGQFSAPLDTYVLAALAVAGPAGSYSLLVVATTQRERLFARLR
jgi:uncharacterized membrane protein YphA (DoxX/SURF4 family)